MLLSLLSGIVRMLSIRWAQFHLILSHSHLLDLLQLKLVVFSLSCCYVLRIALKLLEKWKNQNYNNNNNWWIRTAQCVTSKKRDIEWNQNDHHEKVRFIEMLKSAWNEYTTFTCDRCLRRFPFLFCFENKIKLETFNNFLIHHLPFSLCAHRSPNWECSFWASKFSVTGWFFMTNQSDKQAFNQINYCAHTPQTRTTHRETPNPDD